MKKLLLVSAALLSSSSILCGAVKADEIAFRECMTRYTSTMGVSPDLAFKECKRTSIMACINSLRNKNQVLVATGKTSKGYIIDLGDDIKVWQEGSFWTNRGCKVNKKGPHITRNAPDKNGLLQRYRWFRQGWCKTETVLGREYGEQLAFQECDQAGYLLDSGRNETDATKMDDLRGAW